MRPTASTARGIGASLSGIGACASHCSTSDMTAARDGVSFAKHHDMIDALPSDRTDQPLRISVLPRRSRRDRSISDAHGANTPKEHLAIGSITVMDKIAWSLVPSVGPDQLPGDPFRGRKRCGA